MIQVDESAASGYSVPRPVSSGTMKFSNIVSMGSSQSSSSMFMSEFEQDSPLHETDITEHCKPALQHLKVTVVHHLRHLQDIMLSNSERAGFCL